jgi:hypothetical protein
MPALALFLDKCQYMDHLSAGLQHSALQVSNLCPCRNYTRTVLVYCDIYTISSVKIQQINQPSVSTICLTKLDNSGNETSTWLDVAFYMQMSTSRNGCLLFTLLLCLKNIQDRENFVTEKTLCALRKCKEKMLQIRNILCCIRNLGCERFWNWVVIRYVGIVLKFRIIYCLPMANWIW